MKNLEIETRIFEWDDNKAEINKIKHGIRFETAIKVFSDENRIVLQDIEHSDEEDRWQVIGKVNNILLVVYTERGDSTRIIMARKATAKERRKYNDREKIS